MAVCRKQNPRHITFSELPGLGLSVPVVIHGPDEVFNEWVMGTHDVVIKARHQVVNHNLVHVALVGAKPEDLNIKADSGTCLLARLLGTLAVHPQVGWIHISGMNPISQLGLFVLLELLREIIESFPDLV